MSKQSIACGSIDLMPTFSPWIGSVAAERVSTLERDPVLGDDFVRWHVMGESHYVRPNDPDAYMVDADLTLNVVRDWALARSKGSAFFARTAAIVANQEPSLLDLAAAWNTFAYSNFVQSPLPGPRIQPTSEQWAYARRCFFGQLALTRPTVLVVLGSRQWEQLPWDVGVKLPPISYESTPEWPTVEGAWFYPYRVGSTLAGTVAVKVVHPSAGYGRWNWKAASLRAHTAMMLYSNIIEFIKDTYTVELK